REQRGGQRELERSAVGDGRVVHQLVGDVDVDPFVGADGARVPEHASDVLRRVVEGDRALAPVVVVDEPNGHAPGIVLDAEDVQGRLLQDAVRGRDVDAKVRGVPLRSAVDLQVLQITVRDVG